MSYVVPGMNTDAGSMKDWAAGAQNIWWEQRQVSFGVDNATVAWIGYKTPPIPTNGDFGVLGMDRAEVGADNLARSLRGFDAVRGADGVTLNVIAHSYGTTTSSLALAKTGVQIDNFVSLGSAGIPNSIHDATAIHADRVFAGQAQFANPVFEAGHGDQWAKLGRDYSIGHNGNPIDASFGATTFDVAGDGHLRAVTDHDTHTATRSGYLDQGTLSLRSVAYATTGQPERLVPRESNPPTPLEVAMVLTPPLGVLNGAPGRE